MIRNNREFRFVDASGCDVTGTEETEGYRLADYFACDLDTADDAEIKASYRGPDADGIGVRWSVAG